MKGRKLEKSRWTVIIQLSRLRQESPKHTTLRDWNVVPISLQSRKKSGDSGFFGCETKQ